MAAIGRLMPDAFQAAEAARANCRPREAAPTGAADADAGVDALFRSA